VAPDLSLWGRLREAAEFYRRIAERRSDSHSAAILRLAAVVLEDLGEDVINGYLRRNTVEKAEYTLKLLKRNYLPHYTFETLYSEVYRKLQHIAVDSVRGDSIFLRGAKAVIGLA